MDLTCGSSSLFLRLWVSVELQAAGAAASGERPGCDYSTCPAPSAFSGCTLSACRLLLCSLRSKLGGIDLKAEAFTWSRRHHLELKVADALHAFICITIDFQLVVD